MGGVHVGVGGCVWVDIVVCVGVHMCMVWVCGCVWMYVCVQLCMGVGGCACGLGVWVCMYVCMGVYVMWATNHAPALLPINRHVSSFTVPELVWVRVNVRVRVRVNV